MLEVGVDLLVRGQRRRCRCRCRSWLPCWVWPSPPVPATYDGSPGRAERDRTARRRTTGPRRARTARFGVRSGRPAGRCRPCRCRASGRSTRRHRSRHLAPGPDPDPDLDPDLALALTLTLTLALALTLPLTLPLPLALALTLTLPLALALALALTLALTLACPAPGRGLPLALPLTLTLALLALLPGRPASARSRRASWSRDAASARSRFVSIRACAPVIDSPSRSSADRAPAVSPWARLWAASRRAVAAAPSAPEAVDSISASCRASSRCCSGVVISSSSSPSSSRSSCGLLRVAVAVGVRLAGRGPRQRSASDVSDDARCSVAGSIWARTSLSMAPESRRFAASSPGLFAQLAGEFAQFLGELRRGSSVVLALGVEVVGEVVEPVGLAVGGVAHLALLGDDRVLRVGEDQDRHEQERWPRRVASAGRPRPARPEQGRRRTQGREGVATLATDEAVGLGGVIGGRPRPPGDRRPPVAPMPGTRRRARGRWRRDRRGRLRHRRRGPSRRASGRARTIATSSANATTTGMAAPTIGAASSGTNRATVQRIASATASTASAIQARRTMRRSHRRRRCGTSDARTAVKGRIERGSPGRSADRAGPSPCPPSPNPHARAAAAERTDGRRVTQSGLLLRATDDRTPRFGRQRRVGDTDWTEMAMKTTDRISQVTTLFGQRASRAGASAAGGATSLTTTPPFTTPPVSSTAKTPAAGTAIGTPPGTNPPFPFSTNWIPSLVGASAWTAGAPRPAEASPRSRT